MNDASQRPRVAVRLKVPATPNQIHQLQNLAEDIFRAFRAEGFATVENMDSAIDTIWIRFHSMAKLRRSLKEIRICLKRSLMFDRCEIVIETAS